MRSSEIYSLLSHLLGDGTMQDSCAALNDLNVLVSKLHSNAELARKELQLTSINQLQFSIFQDTGSTMR